MPAQASGAAAADASFAMPGRPLANSTVSAPSQPFPRTPPVSGGRGRAKKWAGLTWKQPPLPEVGRGMGTGEWVRDPWVAGVHSS